MVTILATTVARKHNEQSCPDNCHYILVRVEYAITAMAQPPIAKYDILESSYYGLKGNSVQRKALQSGHGFRWQSCDLSDTKYYILDLAEER